MNFGRFDMQDFVIESWRIEGEHISGRRASELTAFHQGWVDDNLACVTVESLAAAASVFTDGKGLLRDRPGRDVRIDYHYPPLGGYQVAGQLQQLCEGTDNPFYRHIHFEALHPFMDGNGRTGRLLWLRDMIAGHSDWKRGFLHTFYYQTLGSGD